MWQRIKRLLCRHKWVGLQCRDGVIAPVICVKCGTFKERGCMTDLTVTITVTGKSGENKCSIDVDFDPPVDDGVYDGSGVEMMVTRLLETLKQAAGGARWNGGRQ